MTPASNFNDALRRRLEVDLACPKCEALNRRGATVIEVRDDNVAVCGCCRHHWPVSGR
jgi:transcription elongation factor Elf1